jgi:osmotically-inducible protein OsmY
MHEPIDEEEEDAMNKPLATTLGAAAAGALAMYYLDPELGARRRALLADLVRSGLPGERRGAAGEGRAGQRAYHRSTQADPRSDAELRDRVESRLGVIVSYPGAIRVDVDNGVVRLSGRVLAKERDGLLAQVQQIPGVQKLINAMSAHDQPGGITEAEAPVPAEALGR